MMGLFQRFFVPGLGWLLNFEGLPGREEFTDFTGHTNFMGLANFEKLMERKGVNLCLTHFCTGKWDA
jgi:hypothetical protein